MGMLCRDAEPEENWGSGREFAKHFGQASVQVSEKQSLLSAANASSFPRLGFLFKPAIVAMLQPQQPQHADLLANPQGPRSQQCDDMLLGVFSLPFRPVGVGAEVFGGTCSLVIVSSHGITLSVLLMFLKAVHLLCADVHTSLQVPAEAGVV